MSEKKQLSSVETCGWGGAAKINNIEFPYNGNYVRGISIEFDIITIYCAIIVIILTRNRIALHTACARFKVYYNIILLSLYIVSTVVLSIQQYTYLHICAQRHSKNQNATCTMYIILLLSLYLQHGWSIRGEWRPNSSGGVALCNLIGKYLIYRLHIINGIM